MNDMFLSGKSNKMNTPDARKRRTMNDEIYTNPVWSKKIIDHFSSQFQPNDFFMEPCKGDGAFYDHLPANKDWCEITQNKNFLDYDKPIDWIITNYPWSGKALRPLVSHSCKLSNNVVHLIRAHNVFGTYARHRDFLEQGHTLKEIILLPWKNKTLGDVFINKAPEGFALCVVHTQKNYAGDCKWTYWI